MPDRPITPLWTGADTIACFFAAILGLGAGFAFFATGTADRLATTARACGSDCATWAEAGRITNLEDVR